MAVLKRQAKLHGRRFCKLNDFGIGRLRQQNDAGVVGEISVAQLRVTIETETFSHQRSEVFCQKVGEIKRAGLLVVQLSKQFGSGKKLVAMCAGNSLHIGI